MSLDRIGSHDSARAYLQQAERARSVASDASTRDAGADGPRPGPDSVTLSDSARALAAARAAVEQAPDVREARVAEIKQRVQDNTYAVPAHVLARSILDSTAQP